MIIAPLILTGCASQPGTPYTLDTTPLAFVEVAGPEIADHRGRFREILCTVNEDHGHDVPDYRPCGEILHHFSDELPGPGKAVSFETLRSKLHVAVVGGLASGCYFELLKSFPLALRHLQSLGYEVSTIRVDGLSSSAHNGRQIRDAVLDMDLDTDENLILVGYSKGTPDVLEGLMAYPELQRRVAAVISVAGSVNGSPLSVMHPNECCLFFDTYPLRNVRREMGAPLRA